MTSPQKLFNHDCVTLYIGKQQQHGFQVYYVSAVLVVHLYDHLLGAVLQVALFHCHHAL